ncbi:hypothetical protein TNCT_243111 [Trichonephila clavata]|uniref:Uncharacterized protein n=1 Tax=Trichonephila clavata TaxID=2740835 RepID=A0A8X6K941_TRICU|nr:hypothetical protein TNCT_243111 [Trichonephila clavata]
MDSFLVCFLSASLVRLDSAPPQLFLPSTELTLAAQLIRTFSLRLDVSTGQIFPRLPKLLVTNRDWTCLSLTSLLVLFPFEIQLTRCKKRKSSM